MGHDRVHLHGRYSHYRLAFAVKGRELAFVRLALQCYIIISLGRIATVSQLAAEGGPENRDEWFGGLLGRCGYAAAHAAARVLRHVPMLDPNGLAVAARAVVRIGRNVTDGVYVGMREHLEVFIGSERSVLFEGDGRVGFEKGSCGFYPNAQDHEISREGSAVLELDGTDLGRRRGRWLGALHGGRQIEFDAGFFEVRLADFTDLSAHDSLKRRAFHPHHRYIVLR